MTRKHCDNCDAMISDEGVRFDGHVDLKRGRFFLDLSSAQHYRDTKQWISADLCIGCMRSLLGALLLTLESK